MKKMLKARSICWVVFSTQGVHVSTPSLETKIELDKTKSESEPESESKEIDVPSPWEEAARFPCHVLNHLKMNMSTKIINNEYHEQLLSVLNKVWQPWGIDEVDDERRDGEDEDQADLQI